MKVFSISKFVDRFIIFYLYWVGFEWFFLSRINNFTIIQIIRNIVDSLPIIILIAFVFLKDIKLKKHDLLIFLGYLIILIVTAISIIIEIKTPLPIVSYIGVALRFIPFIIILKYSSPELETRFVKNVKIIFWIQIALSVFSVINRELLLSITLPPRTIFEQPYPTAYVDEGISTTFINTVEFIFYILSLSIIYLSYSKKKREKVIIVSVTLLTTIFSFSIASVLGLLIILILKNTKLRLLLLFGISFILALIVFYKTGLLDILLGTDVETWIDISSEYNRIGYFTKLMPEFFNGNLKDIILGFGYDADIVNMKLLHYKNAPITMISNENNLKYLKDVYWISVIMTQGIIVFFITLSILFIIYQSAKQCISKINFNIIKEFLLLILILGFFNQILDIKSFTFCFWIQVAFMLNKPKLNQPKNLSTVIAYT